MPKGNDDLESSIQKLREIYRKEQGLNLTLRLKPSARQTQITAIRELTIYCDVTEPARENRANKAALRLISKRLKIPISLLRITRGTAASIKKIHIDY